MFIIWSNAFYLTTKTMLIVMLTSPVIVSTSLQNKKHKWYLYKVYDEEDMIWIDKSFIPEVYDEGCWIFLRAARSVQDRRDYDATLNGLK